MQFETILCDVADRVATITPNRPERLNAVSPLMVRELRAAYAAAEADEAVWILLVTGAGRAFCAGADVTEIPDDGRVIYDEPYLSTYAQWEAPQEATPPFRSMTKPILTAVNGLCCGAGLDLVATGDTGVAVVNSPLVHLGGLFRVLQCVSDGRSFALLERFTVTAWVDAVRRHRPATASLVPAALRMVLEADIDPADLSSVRSVVSGTAPLSPDDADAFLDKYGIPVLGAYAATEFGGGVAGWNITDYRQFWSAKRGGVGFKVHPDHVRAALERCRPRSASSTRGNRRRSPLRPVVAEIHRHLPASSRR